MYSTLMKICQFFLIIFCVLAIIAMQDEKSEEK